MTVLVTGGSGFLGAALVRELLAAGEAVRVLDDHSRGRSERLDGLDVELVEGDVRDRAAVDRAMAGVEVVWHLAAVNGTRHFYERPDVVLEVGVKGTLHVIDAAVEAGTHRLVLFSSSEVYNQPERVPTPEDERLLVPDPSNPRFSYSGSKIAGELMALHIGAPRGLEPVIIRPHNVYGPDMGHEHVIPEFVRRLVESGARSGSVELPIQGDGSETRAFCYIDDAARGALIAGTRGEAGGLYHLGTDDEVSIGDLASRVGVAMGLDVRPRASVARLAGSTPRRCPDITRLRALGYEPRVGLDDGLAPTVEWYRAHYAEATS